VVSASSPPFLQVFEPGQGVALGAVAFLVGKHEIVAEIDGVQRPRMIRAS
jgi:hypothetical protein